jgi:hypothetical protein
MPASRREERRSAQSKNTAATIMEEERTSGMTRVKSSLELLSHTASLKSEIDALVEEVDGRGDHGPSPGGLMLLGRVSPAASTGDGAANHHHVSPLVQDRIFVSPRGGAAIPGALVGAALDSGYSIEGYEAGPKELSPVPSQPAGSLSEYLARGRGNSVGSNSVGPAAGLPGGGAAAAASLPASISACASTSFLLKFSPSSKALDGLGGGSEFLPPGGGGYRDRHHHTVVLLSRDEAEPPGVLGGGAARGPSLSLSTAPATLLPGSPGSAADLVLQLERENARLRRLVADKDGEVAALGARVAALGKQVAELRQLPTGKISQIPIEYVPLSLSGAIPPCLCILLSKLT